MCPSLDTWIDLRDPAGKLLARWRPHDRVIEIARRGETTRFDLSRPERPERLTDQDQAHGSPGSP